MLFFFSSRRRHTRSDRDWSSDVCSSDLAGRSNVTGFPASEHELFVVENAPSAATFKSRSLPGTETPAVVGSTTTMSFAVPPISKPDPGPGLDATKLLPSTRRVNPLAAPAYTLAG